MNWFQYSTAFSSWDISFLFHFFCCICHVLEMSSTHPLTVTPPEDLLTFVFSLTAPVRKQHLTLTSFQRYLKYRGTFCCTVYATQVTFCSAFLYSLVLWLFAACSCIFLCCDFLQRVSVFACVVTFCSVFLYLLVLWLFAACFCICLCCDFLQRVLVFACVVTFCSVFLYLLVLWLFACVVTFCLCCDFWQYLCPQIDKVVFLICTSFKSIFMCFLNLQCVGLSQPLYDSPHHTCSLCVSCHSVLLDRCSQMFLSSLNWHLTRPISAAPGHVTQLPHRRRRVGQSESRTLLFALRVTMEQNNNNKRFHEMLLIMAAASSTSVREHTTRHCDTHWHWLCVCLCVCVFVCFCSSSLCSAINLNL